MTAHALARTNYFYNTDNMISMGVKFIFFLSDLKCVVFTILFKFVSNKYLFSDSIFKIVCFVQQIARAVTRLNMKSGIRVKIAHTFL